MPGETPLQPHLPGYAPPAVHGADFLPPTGMSHWPTAPYRGETYYGIPPIKHSHYQWRTAAAFFSSSVGGGVQILATLIDLLGRGEDRFLVRAGRYLALGCASTSTVLLISALHTRRRWYNMLRIFKRTSPMSIGIWAITPFGILSGLTAAAQLTEDLGREGGGRRIARFFSLPAALLGTVVMTYMGTEQEETVIPLWASAYPLLAPLYAAAGVSNAAAAMLIAAERGSASPEMKRGLSVLSVVGGTVELALLAILERRWQRLPETRFFNRTGYASLFRHGILDAGMALPLAARVAVTVQNGSTPDPRRSMEASLMRLAGGMLLQYGMIYAGRESGLHARDYFAYTRPSKKRRGNGAGTLFPGRFAPAPVSRTASRKRSPARQGNKVLPYLLGLGALAAGAAMFLSSSGSKGGRHEYRTA